MKTSSVLKWVVAVAMFGMMATTVRATVILDVGQEVDYSVGMVINGVQAGGQVGRDVLMVNNLLGMTLGGFQTIPAVNGENYYRSSKYAVLPQAISVNGVPVSGGGLSQDTDSVFITLAKQYQYLVAAWDGPNGGVEVWNIGSFGIGTVFDIPRYARPTGTAPHETLVNGYSVTGGSKYQLTGWTLLNPITHTPDGGMTVGLLGMALAAMGFIGRKMR